MDLSIIIVSFNTKELLRRCLESIYRARDHSPKMEIIVVDNTSTDGSSEMVNKEFPETMLIRNKQNLGFAKAVNQGLKIAKGNYIFLLNSDTEVKSVAMEKLIKFAREHPEAGIIGARLLNPDSSIQPSVYHLPSIWRAIAEYWLGQKGAYEKYNMITSDAVSVEAVTGAAMLISRKTIETIGFLDERYFMYFEDLDYCRRAQGAGFQVWYLPIAEVIHYHGSSGPSPGVTYQYLVKSSKIYNGIIKYYFITFIIWLGQKWQNFLGNIKF